MGRFLTLMILVASLCAAKPKVDLVWQRGTLIRIVGHGQHPVPEVQKDGHSPTWEISNGSGLMFQGGDQGQEGFWFAVLGDTQREPNVHVGKEYKFAVETVKCLCGWQRTTDQFGRVHQTMIRSQQVMHLIDEDGRETKLDKAQFQPGRTD